MIPGIDLVLAGPGTFEWVEGVVRAATGWPGLVVIAIYSFLVAFILPLPSEVVLLAPLDLGYETHTELGIVMLVSSAGKAAGSVVAFRFGKQAAQSDPVIRFFARFGIELERFQERIGTLARGWGYAGLALALAIPFFPDTLSIYGFSFLEEDNVKFATASFAGSVGRLAVTAGAAGILVSLI